MGVVVLAAAIIGTGGADGQVVTLQRYPVDLFSNVLQSALTIIAYGQRMSRRKVIVDRLVDYWIDRIERLLMASVRDRQQLPAK